MAFNYFNNQSYIGVSESTNLKGVSSLDSTRLNVPIIGGALFRNTTINSDHTHTWTVPAGVRSVSVVCIGGGGGGMYYNNTTSYFSYAMSGGGGGALAWLNDLSLIHISEPTRPY